jgi:hypothetical protein
MKVSQFFRKRTSLEILKPSWLAAECPNFKKLSLLPRPKLKNPETKMKTLVVNKKSFLKSTYRKIKI